MAIAVLAVALAGCEGPGEVGEDARATAEPAADGPTIDEIAPFIITSTDGNELEVGSLKGRPVLVDIWATWCGPCVESMPKLSELEAEYAGRGLQVVAISDETVDEVKAFAERYGYDFLYSDPEGSVQSALGVRAIPATFLYDGEGRLVKHWVGSQPKSAYEGAIKDLGL